MNNVSISPWTVTGFRLSSVIEKHFQNTTKKIKNLRTGVLHRSPLFLLGDFQVDGEPKDTFLNTRGWGKGVAYVNGHNLGRYWPNIGPQLTLYVPSVFLKSGRNSIIILEMEFIPENLKINLQTTPILDFE